MLDVVLIGLDDARIFGIKEHLPDIFLLAFLFLRLFPLLFIELTVWVNFLCELLFFYLLRLFLLFLFLLFSGNFLSTCYVALHSIIKELPELFILSNFILL